MTNDILTMPNFKLTCRGIVFKPKPISLIKNEKSRQRAIEWAFYEANNYLRTKEYRDYFKSYLHLDTKR